MPFFAADEPDAKTLVAAFLALGLVLRTLLDIRGALWPSPAPGREPATQADVADLKGDMAALKDELAGRIAHVEEYAHKADHAKRDQMHALNLKVERLCVLAERNATWHRGRPAPPPEPGDEAKP